MPVTEFILGQRWISNAETDLGLGMVVDIEAKRITLSYPAVGERRTYFEDNAPLTRVRYEVGDTITDLDDRKLRVEQVIEHEDGYLVYQGAPVVDVGSTQDTPEDTLTFTELELNSFVHFRSPQDRLFAGNIDRPRRFQLRMDTLHHLNRLQQSGVNGLIGARVDLLPHQQYIAQTVSQRFAPRVLLADEVGLGKTIEAGLIIHQQLHTGRAQRVLVLLPDSLIHQWLVEMLRRFSLRFTVMDAARCHAIEGNAEVNQEDDATDTDTPNPFESAQLILAPLSLVTTSDDRLQQALACDWDLLCVDEAHHLKWSEDNSSEEYNAVEALAAKAEGLLLLTATPEQLGVESHFARLRLLDPDRYPSLPQFLAEEADYQPIQQAIQSLLELTQRHQDSAALLDDLNRDSGWQAHLTTFIGESGWQAWVDNLKACEDFEAQEAVILSQVRDLLDHHGTGRVLFRNTRASVSGFPERVYHPCPLPQPENWSATDLHPEQGLGEDWLTVDPRVNWLVSFLKEHRQEKILLITHLADTALELEAFLRLRKGVRSSVFHEGMSLLERDRSAAYFADADEGAQLLICSEIGSEGRNFQFAHELVMFDLPEHPDLLEQRIGRLDRIGQQHAVNIYALYFEGSSQEVLQRWYHQGLNAFEQTCAIGQNCYQAQQEALMACLADPTNSEAQQALIDNTQAFAEKTLAELHNGRDRLVELNSCNPEEANRWMDAIEEHSDEGALEDYMSLAFDQLGVDHQVHSEHAQVLRPNESMHSHFPELPDEGLSVCFQREKALSRDDLAFLSWEHPMVTGVMEMIAEGDHGNCSLCTIKLPPLKAGALLVEAVYVLHCPAPKALQLGRYLPVTPIRFLLTKERKDLAKAMQSAQISKLAQKVGKGPAEKLIKHIRADVTDTLEHTQSLAKAQQDTLLAAAKARIIQDQQREWQRLKALSEKNPNIRQSELDHIEQQTQLLLAHLEQAQVRLDAIRLIVTT